MSLRHSVMYIHRKSDDSESFWRMITHPVETVCQYINKHMCINMCVRANMYTWIYTCRFIIMFCDKDFLLHSQLIRLTNDDESCRNRIHMYVYTTYQCIRHIKRDVSPCFITRILSSNDRKNSFWPMNTNLVEPACMCIYIRHVKRYLSSCFVIRVLSSNNKENSS